MDLVTYILFCTGTALALGLVPENLVSPVWMIINASVAYSIYGMMTREVPEDEVGAKKEGEEGNSTKEENEENNKDDHEEAEDDSTKSVEEKKDMVRQAICTAPSGDESWQKVFENMKDGGIFEKAGKESSDLQELARKVFGEEASTDYAMKYEDASMRVMVATTSGASSTSFKVYHEFPDVDFKEAEWLLGYEDSSKADARFKFDSTQRNTTTLSSKDYGNGLKVLVFKHDMPISVPLVSDRQLLVKNYVFVDTKNCFSISLGCSIKSHPRCWSTPKGVVRCWTHWSGWMMKAKAGGCGSDMLYMYNTDYGGSLPLSMLERFQITTPKNWHQAVYDELEENRRAGNLDEK